MYLPCHLAKIAQSGPSMVAIFLPFQEFRSLLDFYENSFNLFCNDVHCAINLHGAILQRIFFYLVPCLTSIQTSSGLQPSTSIGLSSLFATLKYEVLEAKFSPKPSLTESKDANKTKCTITNILATSISN